MTDRKLINQLKATVWIGKDGCTKSTIEEIRRQIKDRKIVKIKWLRNTETDPESIAKECNVKLIQVRGRTMVLAKAQK
ncbi:MAG: YhbY family RNA-binding protein [Methanogenium sp.]|nr:YhbY family RNA-binding protein [Methanogenium sp.]